METEWKEQPIAKNLYKQAIEQVELWTNVIKQYEKENNISSQLEPLVMLPIPIFSGLLIALEEPEREFLLPLLKPFITEEVKQHLEKTKNEFIKMLEAT